MKHFWAIVRSAPVHLFQHRKSHKENHQRLHRPQVSVFFVCFSGSKRSGLASNHVAQSFKESNPTNRNNRSRASLNASFEPHVWPYYNLQIAKRARLYKRIKEILHSLNTISYDWAVHATVRDVQPFRFLCTENPQYRLNTVPQKQSIRLVHTASAIVID